MNEMIDSGTYNGQPIITRDDVTRNWRDMVHPGSSTAAKYLKQQNAMVNDSTIDTRAQLAEELGFAGDMSSETLDYLTQAKVNDFFSEKAFNRELNADSSKYQRAMKDMIAAGLNPAQVLGSLSGSNPGYSPASVSGGYYTESAGKNKDIASKGVTGILAAIAVLGAAMIKLFA